MAKKIEPPFRFKVLTFIFLLAGCVSLVVSLFSWAFASWAHDEEEQETHRLDVVAFQEAANGISSHLRNNDSLVRNISLLVSLHNGPTTQSWSENLLARLLHRSPRTVIGLGYLPRPDSKNAPAFVYRGPTSVEMTRDPLQWGALEKSAGVSVPGRSSWKILPASVSGGPEPDVVLLSYSERGGVNDSGGTALVEFSLSWLAEGLAKISAELGMGVVCLIPDGEGYLCRVANDKLIIENASARPEFAAFVRGAQSPASDWRVLANMPEDVVAAELHESGWLLAMPRRETSAMPDFSWKTPLALMLLALAMYALEGMYVSSRRRREEKDGDDEGEAKVVPGGTPAPDKPAKTLIRRFVSKLVGSDAADAERDRVDSELRVARNIQFSLVPSRFPPYSEWREFDLHSHLAPAREVGGDYYDFFMRDANRIVFAVGDVSGKGIPAAMYMAVCRTAFRILARQTENPGELLTRLNDMLIRDNRSELYITIACFFVDLPSGNCQYALGGHPPPLLRREDGKIEEIFDPRDTFLGLKSGVEYPVGELRLKSGDTLMLYTDGVTDARNEIGEDLTLEGFSRFFAAAAENKSCADIIGSLDLQISQFTMGQDQIDDIALSCFRYWGPGGQKVKRETDTAVEPKKSGGDGEKE